MNRVLLGLGLVASLCALGCPQSTSTPSSSSTRKAKPTSPPDVQVGRTTLVLATTVEPEHQSQLFAESAASRALSMLTQRHLTMYDDKWQLVPDLAVEVPSLHNGGVRLLPEAEPGQPKPKVQHMEVTWHIKSSAVWEDGTPVTADDFLFAFEMQNDPGQEIIERDDIERILKMEAKGQDRKTLIVTWREPYAFFNKFAVHPCLPKHRLKAQLSRPGGGFVDVKRHRSARHPFANGPYRLKEWVKGSHMTFVRNDKHRPLAFIDEVRVRFLPDAQGITAALLAGEVHGVLPEAGLSIAAVADLVAAHPGKFNAVRAEGLVWAHVDFNLDDPWLKDVRVRRALGHAMNRTFIVENLYSKQLTMAHSYLPPQHWGAHPSLPKVDFNLNKANRLLDTAGFRRPEGDPDGIRVSPDGKPLSLFFSAGTGSAVVEQIEERLVLDMRKVGVEVVVDNKPMSVFFSKFARPRKFPHMWFYAWIMSPSSVGATTWQADMIPAAHNQFQGQNFPGWRNAEATRLLKRIVTELDDKKRIRMLHRVQELYAQELPAMPMYFRPVVSVIDPRFTHFSPTGTQTPSTWNAAAWQLRTR